MASLRGRMANLMSRYAPSLVKRGTHRQIERYRASGGTRDNTLFGKPVFLLDVVGRSSGEPRPVMLMLVRGEGRQLIVVGSNGGNPTTPNWYRNLMAAGGGHVEVDGDRWEVTARQLDEGPEREACWDRAVAAYSDFASYQELTDRRLPVAVLDPA